MRTRLDLQQVLEEILGTEYVYFQPPETIRMVYPCIVYVRNGGDTTHADNNPYTFDVNYTVTVIDPNPDSPILEQIAMLPKCRYDRHFTANNLNHDVFTIYI